VIQSPRDRQRFLSKNTDEGSPVNTPTTRIIVFAISALASMAASAADVYTQPQADFRVEYNDNFGLTTGNADSDVGYVADLEALIGIATPRSDTRVRPRARLQEYPDRDDLERFEGSLDLASQYRGQRGNGYFRAGFERRDVYNTETPTGDFDPVDPTGGDDPEAGAIVIGETRTRFDVRPSFDYQISERTTVGGGVYLNTTRYNDDADGPTTKTDYDYGSVDANLTWALSSQSDFILGAYTSRFETTDDSEEIDAVGGLLGYRYRWSDRAGIEARVIHEENDITVFVPVRTEESESNVGGELTAYRLLEVSTWRFSVGRSFIPTGDGGKSEFDQFRLEYERKMNERLGFRGVARYDSRSALGSTGAGLDRDYMRVDLTMRWFMTPTWYIGGGYTYIWNDRELATESVSNNKIFINFGYRGVSRSPSLDRDAGGVRQPL
jgi:hypothetical protein